MNCPKCNCKLEVLDMYDVEHGEEWCVEQFIGQCPICKKEYQWERNFKFFDESNLEECH